MRCRRLLMLFLASLPLRSPAVPAEGLAPHEASIAASWRTTVSRAPAAGPSAASPRDQPAGHALRGVASYYWQGDRTASGEPFDKGLLTAAHPTLPFDTRVKVTELQSGRSVVVRINDRGPFAPGRIIDLSERAAELLGFTARGLAPVALEVVSGD